MSFVTIAQTLRKTADELESTVSTARQLADVLRGGASLLENVYEQGESARQMISQPSETSSSSPAANGLPVRQQIANVLTELGSATVKQLRDLLPDVNVSYISSLLSQGPFRNSDGRWYNDAKKGRTKKTAKK